MRTVARALGRYTAKKAAAEKQGGVLSTLGGFADDVIRVGGRAIGSGLTGKSNLLRAGTAAGLVGGVGAANEGLAYAGLPHWQRDSDPMWSPQLQGTRNFVNNSLGGHLSEMIKRPIQYFTGGNATANPTDAVVNKNIPANLFNNLVRNPDGSYSAKLDGTINPEMAPSYLRMQQMLSAMGYNNGTKPAATPAAASPPTNTKYIFGAPTLPTTSTS